jgi:DNA-binding MarR family transcriptional regulator
MSTLVSTSEDLIQQTIDRFWATIPPVWHRVRGNLRATAAENFGITVEQFHILRHIRKGFKSTSELAEVKQISRSAISQSVDVLVENGLISRCQSMQDRRYVQLELTPNGNELLNAILQKNRAWMTEKLSGLGQDNLRAMMEGMEVLGKAFDESNE